MSRFALVSFAFLGWGFYELSGGAEFTPPERPSLPHHASKASPTPQTNEITVTAASLVTRTTLELRHKDLVRARVKGISGPETATAPPPAFQDIDSAARGQHSPSPQQIGMPRRASLFGAVEGAGEFQLASLEAGLGGGLLDASPQAPLATPVTPLPPAADMRSIRASRVNMRQGPGTGYPIITRLLAGDEVIVLDDNGAGWLHLRTPDNAHFGWIAASLVSKKAP